MKLRSLSAALAALACSVLWSKAQVFDDLLNFQRLGGGDMSPHLALGRDGSIYVTTSGDGSLGFGSLIRFKPDGTVERSPLSSPSSGNERLIHAADGFLYTNLNGPATPIAFDGFVGGGASFLDTPPSGISRAALIQADDGFFYGTFSGGPSGGIFRATGSGNLFSSDGVAAVVADFGSLYGTPLDGVTEGLDGALYVATAESRILRVTKAGVVTPLAQLGSPVRGDLLVGADGHLYGQTHTEVFRMTTNGTVNVVAALPPSIVGQTMSGLSWGSDGALYGATADRIYRVGVEGTATDLADIFGRRSPNRVGGLTLAPDGNFYGVTEVRNSISGLGDTHAIFRYTPGSSFSDIVYEIPSFGIGDAVVEPPILAADGNLYGFIDRATGPELVQISPTGTVRSVDADGTTSSTVLIAAPNGRLYYRSSTGFGAPTRLRSITLPEPGFIFPADVIRAEATLPVDPNSSGPIIVGRDGAIYGLGPSGSNYVLFKVALGEEEDGLITHTPSVVATFSLPSSPNLELLHASDGNFYGTTFEGGSQGLGTIFRVTPEGAMSIVAEFPSTTLCRPKGAMVEGDDGNFYGTVTNQDFGVPGAIFRLTPGGMLDAAATFRPGKGPLGGLVKRSDGRFYGVTDDSGGSGNALGGVFAATTSGELSVVMKLPLENNTYTQLLPGLNLGSDGNLYGALGGRIYRGLWPGPAFVSDLAATPVGSTGATLSAALIARGLATAVVFEYGTDGVNFPSSVGAAPMLHSGYGTRQIGANLTGLPSGRLIHYRVRATNSAGTTVTPVATFTTLAEPVVVVSAASQITPSSARMNGTVNPRGLDTIVVFEFGSDGVSFPGSLIAGLGSFSGNTEHSVSATVTNQQPGRPLFYRLRATSAAGTVISGVRSFSTLTASTTALGDGDVGVTEATFRATIDTFGQTASVRFKYWADAAPGTVFETATQTLTSNGPTEVSARVTGLLENVAYSYRVSVELAGTETDGGVVMFTTETNQAPVAGSDLVFYSGQVVVDPLANDTDANGDALVLDPALVTPPNASLGVASVTGDRRSISYNPQFNVRDDDSLTYRVVDPLGASAQAQVRLIAFSKRAGLYGGKIVFGSGTTAREGQIAVLMGSGGAISTSFMNWPTLAEALGESFVLKGVFDQRGRITRTLNSPSGAVLTLTLQLDADLPQMLGTFEERVNDVSTTGEIAFVLTRNAGTGGLAESGLRTGFLSPPPAQASVMADGFLRMTVGKDRRRGARFAGRLPDGEPFLASAAAMGRTYTLTRTLEQGGLFTGLVRAIDGSAEAGGMLGDLFWQKRASSRARFHRSGVATLLSLSGVAYPVVARGELPPLDLGPADAMNGNARLRFSGSDLMGSYRDLLLNVLPGGVQIIGPDADQAPVPPATELQAIDTTRMKLKVDGPQAKFTGLFLHPQTRRLTPFEGAFRLPVTTPESGNEPAQGRGIFRGPNAAGAVRIEAR